MLIPRNQSQPVEEVTVVPSPSEPIGDVQVTNQAEPELEQDLFDELDEDEAEDDEDDI